MRIILASRSPRRLRLLVDAGFEVTVIPPAVEEARRPGEAPGSYAMRNAADKAEWVRAAQPDVADPVLGADTIVVCDGVILEKPADAADAQRMLRRLSGRRHEVLTGVCILHPAGCHRFLESTGVQFRSISDRDIADYVERGEPLDKAGAYAIQGGAAAFVEQTEGLYSNVVGLPVERVLDALGVQPGL